MTEPTTTPRRGRRGDGTIYTTADGRLRAAVTVPDALTGEPKRRYLSARTDAEMRRKLRDARAEAGPVGRTPTVAQWCERWLRIRAADVRPASLTVYRIHVRHHITPAIGTVELGRLVPTDVERLTGDMLAAGSRPGNRRHEPARPGHGPRRRRARRDDPAQRGRPGTPAAGP